MAAFMDRFLSSIIVLAGADRPKKITQRIGKATADCFLFSSRHAIAKIQIVATQKWAWIPQNVA